MSISTSSQNTGSIDVVDTGLVYRNPNPALQSRHAHFPSLIALPDGELVCGVDIGTAFEAIDVRSYLCRSLDEGKTWSPPEQIFEPDQSAHAVSTSCRIGMLEDGTLLGWACLFDRSRTDQGMVNPENDGFVRTEFAVVRSRDGGRTWSGPDRAELASDWEHFEICCPPFQAGERVLVPSSPLRNLNGETADIPNGIAFASLDGGSTWPELVTVFEGDAASPASVEIKLARLTDGRVLAICWSFDPNTGQPIDNRWATSSDSGKTFSEARDTGIHGETCTPIALEDNHVLCVYRRSDRPGLWSQLARIDGDTWVALADQQLWDGAGYADGSLSASANFEKMGTLQLGLPTLVRLPGGDILIAFWCVEQCAGCIRWYRLRVTH